MKFRDLFKVRQPGNGQAVQDAFQKQTKQRVSIADKGKSVPNGGQKTSA